MMRTAESLIHASLYDGPAPTLDALERIVAVRQSLLQRLPHGQRRLISAARLSACVWLDRIDEAAELADELAETWPQPEDTRLHAATRLAFDAALSEAYLASGRPHRALTWARQLIEHVKECDDPRWHHRGFALAAAAYAFNGEWRSAENAIAAARESGSANSSDAGRTDVRRVDRALALAEGLVAFASRDEARAGELSACFERSREVAPETRAFADLLEAVSLLFAGRIRRSFDLAQRVHQGLTQQHTPRLVRDMALYLHVYVLLHEGEAHRCLGSLQALAPTGSHMLCPQMLRAVANVQLQRYRDVLSDTDECIKARDEHSLWAYPLVVVCRAIAHMRLGHREMALYAVRAAGLAPSDRHFAWALWILPRRDADELIDYVEAHLPRRLESDDIAVLASLRSRVRELCVESDPPRIPLLSRRERVVALHLQSSLTFSEIAKRLSLTPGTVTSQASSIYRKLGVRGRDEAVSCLERLGFFEQAGYTGETEASA